MGLLWIVALLTATNYLLQNAEGSSVIDTPLLKDDFRQPPQKRSVKVETSPDIGSLRESEVEEIQKRSTPAHNVALKREPSQSSTKGGKASRYSTDGDLAAECSSTEVEYEPWWKLDLGSNHIIFSVAITSQGTCCAQDLIGTEIHIGNKAAWRENPSCGVVSSIDLGETYSFSCQGMIGQFVTIAVPEKSVSLTLCEVQVFGNRSIDEIWNGRQPCENEGAPNVAPKGKPTQSSNHERQFPANLANDGSLANTHPQCSHTSFHYEPWWNLDLKFRMRVFSIAITNRHDCCGHRLNGAEIRVGFSKDNVRNNVRCAILTTVDQGGTLAVNCHGIEGQYVSVLIPGRSEYLTLCEVQVFALRSDEQERESCLVDPPDVPPVFNCDSRGAEFHLPLNLVFKAKLNIDDIHLKDPMCKGTKKGKYVVINVPFNRCGSKVLNKNGKSVYVNTVYGTVPSSGVHRIAFPLKCEMNNNKTLEWNLCPQVTDMVSLGDYNISLKFYEDEAFNDPITEFPCEIDLHSRLYVEFEVESKAEDLQLFVENCQAAPSLEETEEMNYKVIREGCYEDSTLEEHPVSDQRFQHFSFHVFKFDDLDKVYLSCNVIICHNGTSPNRCTEGCLHRRRRRDVQGSIERLNSVTLSQGPIIFSSDAALEHLVLDSSPGSQHSSPGRLNHYQIGLPVWDNQPGKNNLTYVYIAVIGVMGILSVMGMMILKHHYRTRKLCAEQQ